MQAPLQQPMISNQPAMVVQHPQMIVTGSPPPTRGKWFWGLIILGTILFLTTIIILGSYDPRDNVIHDTENGDTFKYRGEAMADIVSVYTTQKDGCEHGDKIIITLLGSEKNIFDEECGNSGDAFEVENDPDHASGYDRAIFLGEVDLVEGKEYRVISDIQIILVDESMVAYGGFAFCSCCFSWIAVLIIGLSTRSSRNAMVYPVNVIPQPVQNEFEQQH